MLDANGLLGRLFQDPGTKGAVTGFAGGALGGLLTNKKARKSLGKTAVTAGGVAAVAGLAYWAYQRYQKGTPGQPVAAPAAQASAAQPSAGDPAALAPPADSGFVPDPADTAACNGLALKLVRAMIAAANADGRMDGDELKRVLDAIEQAELPGPDKASLLQAMNAPETVDQIAALAAGEAEAMELYAASVAAIEVDTPAEHAYLSMLASQLRLPADYIRAVHEMAAEQDARPAHA
jgi:uncharacterized membrane protein YebE (DUF533 family)